MRCYYSPQRIFHYQTPYGGVFWPKPNDVYLIYADTAFKNDVEEEQILRVMETPPDTLKKQPNHNIASIGFQIKVTRCENPAIVASPLPHY